MSEEGHQGHTAVCPACGHHNQADAAVCAVCGTLLASGQPKTVSPEASLEVEVERPGAVELELDTIAFFVAGAKEPIIVKGQPNIVLGRSAPDSPPPTVDLAEHLGHMYGVSRRHALITVIGDTYVIKDLDSTNGTWVNNVRLPTGKLFALNNGDQIQLGKLKLLVYFAAVPPTSAQQGSGSLTAS